MDGGTDQSTQNEDEGGDTEDNGEEDRHLPLPSSMIGLNSPRKRAETSNCWSVVKRLKSCEDAPSWAKKWFSKGYSHVCIHEIPRDTHGGTVCNTPLRLHKLARGKDAKPSWVTTHATTHISRYHKDHVVAKEVVKREKGLQTGRVSHLLGVKDEPPQKSAKTCIDGKADSMKRFVLSKRQWQITRQARWYIYTTQ